MLDKLGARTSAITYDGLTEKGRGLFRTALIDTLGVALAGSDFEAVRIARDAIATDGSGTSLILGTSDRTNALDAGMLNGMASHALDYDDGNALMGGHPSTLLIPALLALGEELDSKPKDVIAAYAAGYEVIIRVSRGVNTAHYEKGWHPTSTIGVLGVAAAAARLLELDPERSAVAIAIAASMASGLKGNFGTMVKSLHVGHAVRDGLASAKLAGSGFTANRSVMEAAQGYLNVLNGAGSYDAAVIVAEVETAIGAADTEVNPIKIYPCCASTHSPINAALEIRGSSSFRSDEVARVDVVVDRNRMPHTDRPHLQEALSGKFSMQYVVARALTDGRVSLDHFEGNAHRDPAVLEMMRKVHIAAAPQDWTPNSFDAEVSITTTDGRTFSGKAEHVAADQMRTEDEPVQLWDKFIDCAGRVMSKDEVSSLQSALRTFPECDSVRGFMRLVEVVK